MMAGRSPPREKVIGRDAATHFYTPSTVGSSEAVKRYDVDAGVESAGGQTHDES